MFLLNKNRDSGTELLKVLALFGIVLCHTYTVFAYAPDYTNNGITFFETNSLKTIEYLAFQAIITLGYLGNTIFFVSSSWYLADKESNRKDKIVYFIVSSILVSILIYMIYLCFGKDLSADDLLISITPISHSIYWYITCYVILYFIYPYINKSLNNINQSEHLSLALGLFFIYFIYSYFANKDLFYINKLISFISTYIIVSYLKKYKKQQCDNKKINIIVLLVSSFAFYLLIFINFAITPINLDWHRMYNPFFLIMSMSAFNVFRNLNFKSSIINTISALSLYIYMFHANYLVQNNTTEQLAISIMKTTGMDNIVFKIVGFSLILFIVCFIISLIFYLLFNSLISKLSKYIELKISNMLNKLL